MFGILDRTEHKVPVTAVKDAAVKLNGTEIAQLINLRIEHAQACSCERCADLLTKIHFNGTVLEREHKNELWGLKFWKRTSASVHDPRFEFCIRQEVVEPTLEELNHHLKLADTLIEAEDAWNRSEQAGCVSQDCDDFWMRHYQSIKTDCDTCREQLVVTDASIPILTVSADAN